MFKGAGGGGGGGGGGGREGVSTFGGGWVGKMRVTYLKEGCSFYIKNKLKNLKYLMTNKFINKQKCFFLS